MYDDRKGECGIKSTKGFFFFGYVGFLYMNILCYAEIMFFICYILNISLKKSLSYRH